MSDSLNISLRFGSPKHTKILEALVARKTLSEKKMSNLYSEFEAKEDQYLAYIPETDADAARSVKREVDGKPQYTTIQIPLSYAIMLSAHTFRTSVFLGRDPIQQFTGRHGETQQQVQAVEAVMQYQSTVGGQLPVHYNWMHDAPKYGFSVVWNYWEDERRQVSRIVEKPATFFGLPIEGKTKKAKETFTLPGYTGNKLMNVRPYDYLPDPRVPLMEPQKGEFCGRKVRLDWNMLVRGKAKGQYFNLDIVQKLPTDVKEMSSWGSERVLQNVSTEEIPVNGDIKNIHPREGFEMVVELIPHDWGLGESTQPEKWVFSVIGDMIVVEARPQGAWHGKFPAVVLPEEFDAYKLNYRSMLDVLKPLNDTLDWLINTHFFNVRSSMNNQFIFDPYRVVAKDLYRNGTSKLIRLKETAYGTDVRSAITQLQVNDVTQNHLRDAQVIIDMMQRVSGVTDNIMGMVNNGGRKTATEIRSSNSFGANRLKTLTEYWSAVAFSPLAQMQLQATQQYYTQEQKFQMAGDLLEEGQKFLTVNPQAIAGAYDFVAVDGTQPIDRYAQANLWREMMAGMSKIPQVAQQYDMGGIFGWMAQLAGLKNIKQFKIQVLPDGQLQDQSQAGNVVPLGGTNDGSGNIGGTPGGASGVPEPGQISGMGATG